MNPKDFAFKVPLSVFVAGPSQSGKTRFTQQILKHIGKGILSKPIKKLFMPIPNGSQPLTKCGKMMRQSCFMRGYPRRRS